MSGNGIFHGPILKNDFFLKSCFKNWKNEGNCNMFLKMLWDMRTVIFKFTYNML